MAWQELRQMVTLCWPLLLGNVLEWYEFAIFGFVKPFISENFFQGSSQATWLVFATTFAARPFGGLLLGMLGDLCGRKVSTFASIFGMLIGTVGQGLLPSYRSGDVAGATGVALLTGLRILQGLSTGGETCGVSTYIVEVGPKSSLGLSSILISITGNLGFLLAQLFTDAPSQGTKALQHLPTKNVRRVKTHALMTFNLIYIFTFIYE